MNVLYRINKKGEFEKHYGHPKDEMISGYDLTFFIVPGKRKNSHKTFYCSPRPKEVIGCQSSEVWLEEENDVEAKQLLLSYELERTKERISKTNTSQDNAIKRLQNAVLQCLTDAAPENEKDGV